MRKPLWFKYCNICLIFFLFLEEVKSSQNTDYKCGSSLGRYLPQATTGSHHAIVGHSHQVLQLARDFKHLLPNILIVTLNMSDIYIEKAKQYGLVNLKVSHGISKCKEDTLTDIFAKYKVASVHFMYSSKHFAPYLPYKEQIGVLNCHIEVLQTVAHSKRPIDVFWHIRSERIHPLYHQGEVTESTRPRWRCKPDYDIDEYYDVFIKSADLYTWVFQKLYKLKFQRFVH